MKPKKRTFTASLAACALAAGLLASCSIDEAYDLDKDIDATIGLGAEGLTLRLGSTEPVMLADVLDIDDTDLVETDAESRYYLVRHETTHFDVTVRDALGTIDRVDVDSEQEIVSYDDADAQGMVADGQTFTGAGLQGVSNLGTMVDDISPEVVSVRTLLPRTTAFTLRLELVPSRAGLNFRLRSVEGLSLKFPAYMRVEGADADGRLALPTLAGLNAASVELAPVVLHSIDFGPGPDGLGVPIQVDADGSRYIDLTDEVTMQGDFVVAAVGRQQLQPGDNVKVRMVVQLAGGGRIEAERLTGQVDPEMSPEIDPVAIREDLPSFLTDERVELVVDNPTLRFDFDATQVPVPVEFAGQLTAVSAEGQTMASADVPAAGRSLLPAGRQTTYYYSATGQPYDPAGLRPGSQSHAVPALTELLRRLPDVVRVDCGDGRVGVQQGVLHDVELNRTYSAAVDYELLVPFTFRAGTTIVYVDSITDMNADLQDYRADGLQLTADVLNTVPMALEVSLEPVDADGQTMTDIVVTPATAEPATAQGPVRTPIALELRAASPDAVSRLDMLRVRVVAAAKATGELRSDQYFLLENIRLRLTGQVVGDFN